MSAGPKKAKRALLLWSDALSTRLGTVLVFLLSVLLLLGLMLARGTRSTPIKAVVYASPIEAHSLLATTVKRHEVSLGESVKKGQALVTLDTVNIERALERVAREVEALQAQLDLQAAQIRVDQQGDAIGALRASQTIEASLNSSRARTTGSRRTLSAARRWRDNTRTLVEQGAEPRSALLEAEKEVADAKARELEASAQAATHREHADILGDLLSPETLKGLSQRQEALARASLLRLATEREHLEADLENAVLKSKTDGRVSALAPIGSRADSPLALAVVIPEESHILVGYLPASVPQEAIPSTDQGVELGTACGEAGTVTRVGAAVEAAPEYLVDMPLQERLYGLPIFIKVPPSCPMKPGFVLEVEIHP